jgi:hypothetical protein
VIGSGERTCEANADSWLVGFPMYSHVAPWMVLLRDRNSCKGDGLHPDMPEPRRYLERQQERVSSSKTAEVAAQERREAARVIAAVKDEGSNVQCVVAGVAEALW